MAKGDLFFGFENLLTYDFRDIDHAYNLPWRTSIRKRFSQMRKNCPTKYWANETLRNWVEAHKGRTDHHITAKELVLEHIKECETCKKQMTGVPLIEALNKSKKDY